MEDLTGRQEDLEMESEDPDAVSLAEALEADKQDVLSQDTRTLNMRHTRATYIRGNIRGLMPGLGLAVVEAEHTTRMDVWDKVLGRYIAVNCNDEGNQHATYLSKNQALGLKTVKKDCET